MSQIVTIPFNLIHIHPRLFVPRQVDAIWVDFLLSLRPAEVASVLPEGLNITVMELAEHGMEHPRVLAVGGICPERAAGFAQAWAIMSAKPMSLAARRHIVRSSRKVLTDATAQGYAIEASFSRDDPRVQRWRAAMGFE